MSRLASIHWLRPAGMLVAFICGILLALGHHLFYQDLDGKPIGNNSFSILGSDISRQQASIAIGTAFAFLVKASLVYAVSIAMIQIFWKEAKARNAAPTLTTLDSLAAAGDNLLVLLDLPLWTKYWFLLLVATIAWYEPLVALPEQRLWANEDRLLPIASIVTPATLSTQLVPVLPVRVRETQVPNLDFRNLGFVDPMARDVAAFSPYTYVYRDPSQAVMTTVGAAMAGGSINTIVPPAVNSSWQLQFDGPSIRCQHLNKSMHLQVRQNVAAYLNSTYEINKSYGQKVYNYMAWFPAAGYWRGDTLNYVMPLKASRPNSSLAFSPGTLKNTMYIFASETRWDRAADAEALFYNLSRTSYLTPPAWINGITMECSLFNSSYNVSFVYQDGLQQIDARSTLHPDSLIAVTERVMGPAGETAPGSGARGQPCALLTTAPMLGEAAKTGCFVNTTLVRELAYQAIWDAFTRTLQGEVYTVSTSGSFKNSSIVNTALVNTRELAFMRNPRTPDVGETLDGNLLRLDDEYLKGLIRPSPSASSDPGRPLATALEQMFRDVTVSLMGSAALQPNKDSPTAPPPAQVTMPAYHIVYVYTPWRLWLPYGIAILLTAIVVLIGLLTMLSNHASYDNAFSTIFRVARGSKLSARIQDEDLEGKDPLPKYLTKAYVTVAGHSGGAFKYTAIHAHNAPVDIAPQKAPSYRARAASVSDGGTGTVRGSPTTSTS